MGKHSRKKNVFPPSVTCFILVGLVWVEAHRQALHKLIIGLYPYQPDSNKTSDGGTEGGKRLFVYLQNKLNTRFPQLHDLDLFWWKFECCSWGIILIWGRKQKTNCQNGKKRRKMKNRVNISNFFFLIHLSHFHISAKRPFFLFFCFRKPILSVIFHHNKTDRARDWTKQISLSWMPHW